MRPLDDGGLRGLTRTIDAIMPKLLRLVYVLLLGYIARAVLTPTSLSCTNEIRERTKRKILRGCKQRQILSKTVTKKSNETGKLT